MPRRSTLGRWFSPQARQVNRPPPDLWSYRQRPRRTVSVLVTRWRLIRALHWCIEPLQAVLECGLGADTVRVGIVELSFRDTVGRERLIGPARGRKLRRREIRRDVVVGESSTRLDPALCGVPCGNDEIRFDATRVARYVNVANDCSPINTESAAERAPKGASSVFPAWNVGWSRRWM
jgi:hypothetical protein